jgi:hypothetical protein
MVRCQVSMVEVYNDQLFDLLVSGNSSERPLSMVNGPNGVVVQDLTELPVKSVEDVIAALSLADNNRTVAFTKVAFVAVSFDLH